MNNTKDMIIDKSFLLFLNEGINNITITKIIENAGISNGTFYYYFKNKDQLVLEVMKKYVFDLGQKKLDYIKYFNGSSKEQIRYLILSLLGFNLFDEAVYGVYLLKPSQYRDFHILIIDATKQYEEVVKMDHIFHNKLKKTIESIIKKGINNREIININPIEITNLIYSVYTSICYKTIKEPELDIEKSFNRSFNYLWNIIKIKPIVSSNNQSNKYNSEFNNKNN